VPNMHSLSNIVLALSVALLAACGPGELGQVCEAPGDCVDELTCVSTSGLALREGASECVPHQLCSIPCASDSDCAATGTASICVESCGVGPAVCVVGRPD